MDTLEDLYYGNLFPHEKSAKLDDEVKELLKLLNRNEEKLTVTLSDDQKDTFEKTSRIAIDTNGHQLELPIKLNAYESTKGYMFLPFFVFNDELPHKIKVEFGTTRHRKKLIRKCVFRPFVPDSVQDLFDPNQDYKW